MAKIGAHRFTVENHEHRGISVTEIGTPVTHPLIAAVRAAEAACLTARTDEERRSAEVALVETVMVLREKINRLYNERTMTGWLIDAGDWLDSHTSHPELFEREERWLERKAVYEAMLAAEIDARAVLFASGVTVEAVTEQAMEQGGLL